MPDGYLVGGTPGGIIIGTSEEDIVFADMVPGVVAIQNHDLNNYVRFGPNSGGNMVPLIRIPPGKTVRLYLDEAVTLRAVANSAPVSVTIKGYPGYTTTTTTT
jgi:hypothetical protein